MNVGYTQKQADRIKRGIDIDLATIEDVAYRMRRRVADISVTTASVERQLEELREAGYELKAIVDRRTR